MNSNQRIMEIFTLLYRGERISLEDTSKNYGVSLRTIQRDLSTIKESLITNNLSLRLRYDTTWQTYSLENLDHFSIEEVVMMNKILLESRAFTKKEIEKLLDQLLSELSAENRKTAKLFLNNELVSYYPLKHQTQLLQRVGEFIRYISEKTVLIFEYCKNRGEVVSRKGLPVSLFFSEYYFYIILYNPIYHRYLSYRLDRFLTVQPTAEKINIPYSQRLEDSELRKKLHLMYAGKEVTFTFRFWGIAEAALDKLPNAKIIGEFADASVCIEAVAYDTGVIMWLLSQGSNVQVLSPPSFVDKVKEEIRSMQERYREES